MCLVASGCVEAYYEIGIHVWDVAAGLLIVAEAGGVLMDVEGKKPHTEFKASVLTCSGVNSLTCVCSGGQVDMMSRRIVAANSRTIAERIVKEIDVFSPSRDDAVPLNQ